MGEISYNGQLVNLDNIRPFCHIIQIRNEESIRSIFPFQTISVVLVLMVLAVASSQDYSQLFAGFGPYLRQSAIVREIRSDSVQYLMFKSPVLFPPGPPPNNADSSGVIAGASGYGFVPPNQVRVYCLKCCIEFLKNFRTYGYDDSLKKKKRFLPKIPTSISGIAYIVLIVIVIIQMVIVQRKPVTTSVDELNIKSN
ncbi:hypothetical protein WN51_08419 [Melipona quadrifasciata]|uniref:Uncharacterized protein n=1 Tax=Melipona quadrifasciata TaxID=166423 RepID=A0A0N0BK93_9HYME|nr:hypothetical protein WN51_08419 [Melipona quadrifasciata]